MKKHKNTKADPNYCSQNKKIGKGKFGSAFDEGNGKEAEAGAPRLEWSQQNKDENNITEKINRMMMKILKIKRSAKKVK